MRHLRVQHQVSIAKDESNRPWAQKRHPCADPMSIITIISASGASSGRAAPGVAGDRGPRHPSTIAIISHIDSLLAISPTPEPSGASAVRLHVKKKNSTADTPRVLSGDEDDPIP